MLPVSRELIENAIRDDSWDFANEVLYALCAEHPDHKRVDVTIAKVWLIGRTYAAEIERHRKPGDGLDGDQFYEQKVGPGLCDSKIDEWFQEVREGPPSGQLAVEAHRKLVDEFQEISGHHHRSLASKYLHFHFPDRFYIFDTRASAAVTGMLRATKQTVPRVAKGGKDRSDSEYRRLFAKCEALNAWIAENLGLRLSPRDLDKVLLRWAREPPPRRSADARGLPGPHPVA